MKYTTKYFANLKALYEIANKEEANRANPNGGSGADGTSPMAPSEGYIVLCHPQWDAEQSDLGKKV